MESGNVESHKVAILPCGQVVEQWNGTPVEGTRGPGPLGVYGEEAWRPLRGDMDHRDGQNDR